MEQFKPEVVAVEQLYAHYDHPRTAILMGHARGVIFLAAAQRGLPVLSYNATRIKKTITGNGRASKEQVQRTIQRELGLAAAAGAARRGRRPGGGPVPLLRPEELPARGRRHDYQNHRRPEPRAGRGSPPAGRRRWNTRSWCRSSSAAQSRASVGQELTLHTSHYLDGNPMQGRVVPRLIGFAAEAELDFFELFCTVDKVGTRKALKALVRPVKEIADAIQRQDAKWLTTLPGVGAATAEQIIATLRRKVTKFALMARRSPQRPAASRPAAVVVDGNVLEDAYQALLSVGHSPARGAQPARQGPGRRPDVQVGRRDPAGDLQARRLRAMSSRRAWASAPLEVTGG